MGGNKFNAKEFPLKGIEQQPVKVVGNAGIATLDQCEGKIIPVLIIDTSDRPDIDELVKFQQQSVSGDVASSWGWREPKWWHRFMCRPDQITLFLQFTRPSTVNIMLDFDFLKDGILVDAILNSQAVFLQPGRKGDRVRNDLNKPKILAEVPQGDIIDVWYTWWRNAVAKKLSKDGLKRKDALKAASDVIEQTRKVSCFRMRHKITQSAPDGVSVDLIPNRT